MDSERPQENAVQRLQEALQEQARRACEDRLAREARHRWEDTHADAWPGPAAE